MAMSLDEVASIIRAEESKSVGFLGAESTINSKRANLLKYYEQDPTMFGPIEDGCSKVVTSDVHDVVETVVPQLVDIFTKGKYIATFSSPNPEYDEENEQKTQYAHWVFNNLHDGTVVLHDMFKDGVLQYTGVVKTYWDSKPKTEYVRYENIDELNVLKLKSNDNFIIKLFEEIEIEKSINIGKIGSEYNDMLPLPSMTKYNVEGEWIHSNGKPALENIPPEELIISLRAKDFINPPFIGQRSRKTRSDLVRMGFDKDVVDTLVDQEIQNTEVKTARDINNSQSSILDANPTMDKSRDELYLGEYYLEIDMNEDGIGEYYQVFFAGGKILEMNRVAKHPYAVFVPIRIPHRAIGTCPADEVADIQALKTALTRQMVDNAYLMNHQRLMVNDDVDVDTIEAGPGNIITVSGKAPVQNSCAQLPIQTITNDMLASLEYVDTQREIRTGITRQSQGIQGDILNKTASAYLGMRDTSQQRIQLMAKLAAGGPIKHIFERIIDLATEHHIGDAVEFMLYGKPQKIDPSKWKSKASCSVVVGPGGGERQEKIGNYNALLSIIQGLKQTGSVIVDEKKIYNVLQKMLPEMGIKNPEDFLNNPEQPDEILLAENEQLKAQIQQMQQIVQQAQTQIVDAERIKAEASQINKQVDTKLKYDSKQAELEQKERFHNDDMALKLSELEIETKQNIPGSLV